MPQLRERNDLRGGRVLFAQTPDSEGRKGNTSLDKKKIEALCDPGTASFP